MIYFVCKNAIYAFVIEYLNSIIENILNSKLIFCDDFKDLTFNLGKEDVVVFVQKASDIILSLVQYNKVYILNIEQASQLSSVAGFDFDQEILKYLKLNQNIGLMDYSRANVQHIQNYLGPDVNVKNTMIMPYFENKNEKFPSGPKPKDIAFIGTLSDRRKNILMDLALKGLNVEFVSGFGPKRDLTISKFKILLNLHFADNYTVFEEIRCNRAVFNHIIVVSEPSELDPKNPTTEFIHFSKVEDLAEKLIFVLANYESLSQKDLSHLNKNLKNYAKEASSVDGGQVFFD